MNMAGKLSCDDAYRMYRKIYKNRGMCSREDCFGRGCIYWRQNCTDGSSCGILMIESIISEIEDRRKRLSIGV